MGNFFDGVTNTLGEGFGGVVNGFLKGGIGGAIGGLGGLLPEFKNSSVALETLLRIILLLVLLSRASQVLQTSLDYLICLDWKNSQECLDLLVLLEP